MYLSTQQTIFGAPALIPNMSKRGEKEHLTPPCPLGSPSFLLWKAYDKPLQNCRILSATSYWFTLRHTDQPVKKMANLLQGHIDASGNPEITGHTSFKHYLTMVSITSNIHYNWMLAMYCPTKNVVFNRYITWFYSFFLPHITSYTM
jgi:hypothetical protein